MHTTSTLLTQTLAHDDSYPICALDIAQHSDVRQTLDLVRLVFGDVDRAYEDFFRWQSQDNPAGPALLAVAKHQGEIVGRTTFLPKDFWTGQRVIKIAEGMESATHPLHRGKGIFLALMRALHRSAREGKFAFSYAIGYQRLHMLCTRYLQYTDQGNLPVLVYPLAIGNLDQVTSVPSWMRKMLPLIMRLHRVHATFRSHPALTNVCESDTFDSRFDVFWNRVKGQYRNLLVRDRKYLQWRYKDIPRRVYSTAIVEEAGEILGFCVTRVADFNGLRLGLLVDLLAEGGTDGSAVVSNLLMHALEEFRSQGVHFALGYFTGSSLGYRAALRTGFLRCPRVLNPKPSHVILSSYDADALGGSIGNLLEGYLTLGDFDFG